MSNPEELIPILTVVAIVLVVIIFVLIGIWIFVVSREKKNNKEKESGEDAEKNGMYNMQSIMDFMEFEKIEDNMIVQKKGKYLMVLECQGINFDLMSEMEMTAVEQGFIEFLNTLKFEIQLYVQTRTVNLEDSLREYKLKFRDIEDKYNVLQNKYIQMKEAETGIYSDKEIYKAYVEYIRQKNKYEYTRDIIADTEKK